MNILLHICCAPCSIYPIDQLRKGGHRIAGYYYNPNIHPYSEYLKRRSEADKYSKDSGVNMIAGDYELEKYLENTTYSKAPKNRCSICWWIRLERTAKFAKENGFEAFTTTLLGSPYQDHEVLRKIAVDIADKTDIKFHYEDYRTGFRRSTEKAKSKGIYLQNYCGCVFSKEERS